MNRESMNYNHAYSLWITSVEHLIKINRCMTFSAPIQGRNDTK